MGQKTETVRNKGEVASSFHSLTLVLLVILPNLLFSAPTMPSSWVLWSLPAATTYMLVAPQSTSPAQSFLQRGRPMYPTVKWPQMLCEPLYVNMSKLDSSSFSLAWAPPAISALVNGITDHHGFWKPGSHPQDQIGHKVSILFHAWRPQNHLQLSAWGNTTNCSELCIQWNRFAICQDLPDGFSGLSGS